MTVGWRAAVTASALLVSGIGAGAFSVDAVRAANRSTATAVGVTLTGIATGENPVGILSAPESDQLLVIEQGGRIRPIVGDKAGSPVFDVSSLISDGNEQGLLGAAFSNDGAWLFTNHTGREGDTEVSATPWADGTVLQAKRVVLLRVQQPYANHNGGGLVVDRSGVLWIGLGDGGSGGDPENRAQNLNSLLGKMLRIVPTPDQATRYRIPPGNIERTRGRPEIWGYGLRNPWRFSVDETTATVWIGDVGQNKVEEINAVSTSAKSPNFGWRRREGNIAFKGTPFKPGESIEPVHTYTHASGGCSVTGGVVYRGSAITALQGSYLFADFCEGTIRAISRVRRSSAAARPSATVTSLGLSADQVSSFGTDRNGEIYVTALGGEIYRLDPTTR